MGFHKNKYEHFFNIYQPFHYMGNCTCMHHKYPRIIALDTIINHMIQNIKIMNLDAKSSAMDLVCLSWTPG